MPRIAKEYELTVRGHIRRLLIMDGTATDLQLTKAINKIGIPFGIDYVRDQRRKILKEKLRKGLSYVLTEYLQHFIDTMSEADRRLWQMASDESVDPGNRIYALAQIRENRKVVFDKLFEAGIFEKQLGNLNLRSFMDIVKDVASHDRIKDAEFVEGGSPADTRTLEEKPGGSNPSPVGQGLADLVRATANTPVSSGEQTNGGK